MSKPKQNPQPSVYRLDFSGKQPSKDREVREAEADRQLVSEPHFRELQQRIAASEEQLAGTNEKKGCLYLLRAAGIAGATIGVDYGVGEIFNMQQLLQGEDVTSWPQRITHGVILGVGGLSAMYSAVVGFDIGLDAEAQRVSADRHRRGKMY